MAEHGMCTIPGIALSVEQAHKKPVTSITLTKQELINCKGQMFFSCGVVRPGPVVFSVSINGITEDVFDHEKFAGTDLKERQTDYQPVEFMFPIGYTKPRIYTLVVIVGYREDNNDLVWYDKSPQFTVTIKE